MSIAENISRVEEQIATACRKAGRAHEEVRLMAVTKTQPPYLILEAYAAGICLFGENRVQEYAGKQPVLAGAGVFGASSAAAFHCIGPVQSNKAARATQIFDAIDTIDSLQLAERLDRAAKEVGKRLPVLIEIKLSPEAAKHGIPPDGDVLENLLERLPQLSNLEARGLMTVPPYADDPEEARPYFRRLRNLRESLVQRTPNMGLVELSMGMSHDFFIAIEEGATQIRVGTAIFGTRTSHT